MKAANDPSGLPPRLEESGFGEVEFNLRYRWREETRHRPEMFRRQVSPAWRFVTALEMEDDEVSLITEGQWRIRERITIKLNSGFGVTPKAPDVAPEVGVLFSF